MGGAELLSEGGEDGELRDRKDGGAASFLWSERYVVALTRGSDPSFQAETKDSSRGTYDKMSCRKPECISGNSYGWRVVGSDGVFLKLMGLFLRTANELAA